MKQHSIMSDLIINWWITLSGWGRAIKDDWRKPPLQDPCEGKIKDINLCCQPSAVSDLDSRDLCWLDCFMLTPAWHAVALLGLWHETQTQPIDFFLPQDFYYHYYKLANYMNKEFVIPLRMHILYFKMYSTWEYGGLYHQILHSPICHLRWW